MFLLYHFSALLSIYFCKIAIVNQTLQKALYFFSFLMYNINIQNNKESAMQNKHKDKKQISNCESCVFYDYDEDFESYVCTVNLDQDEMGSFLSGQTRHCPYYRFYDEYKSVQKQN